MNEEIIKLRKQGRNFQDIAILLGKSVEFVRTVWNCYQSDQCCFK